MILLWLIILVVLVALSFIYLKEILDNIDSNNSHLRKFVHNNSGLFSLLFMSLFFLEQFTLIFMIYYFFDVSSDVELLISIFALIVLTTAALEKFILEKKYHYLWRETITLSHENEKTLETSKKIYGQYQESLKENLRIKEELEKKR